MTAIPKPISTLDLVDRAIEVRAESRDHRNYMGLSGVGEECDRKLWYSYKQPKKITGAKINRTFDLGNAVEDLVINWLSLVEGFTVITRDENGEQFGGTDEMLAWHIDGVIQGLPESGKPHLLEIKSAKDDRYKAFVKDGLQKTDSKYYAQCQTYMHKEGLERALFIVVNKDTSEMYMERVRYNKMEATYFINRAKEIARAEEPPARKYNTKAFFKCKWCDWKDECWSEDDNISG